jgi:hypothetical protein
MNAIIDTHAMPHGQIIIRTYYGRKRKACGDFKADAIKMAEASYFPATPDWLPGTYGGGIYSREVVTISLFIGIFVFVYILIAKPPGQLNVTYRHRNPNASAAIRFRGAPENHIADS